MQHAYKGKPLEFQTHSSLVFSSRFSTPRSPLKIMYCIVKAFKGKNSYVQYTGWVR